MTSNDLFHFAVGVSRAQVDIEDYLTEQAKEIDRANQEKLKNYDPADEAGNQVEENENGITD